jgi:hypothetical protein
MTALFRMKNLSHDDSMMFALSNLKEKLVQYDNQNLEDES